MFGSGCKHGTICERPASPLASSMLLWSKIPSFLKPQWSYANRSQSGSRCCFRPTQDSPGVGLPRLWLHARLNPANESSVFFLNPLLAGRKVSVIQNKNGEDKWGGKRQISYYLPWHFCLDTLECIRRCCVAMAVAMCVFSACSASLLLRPVYVGGQLERKNSDSTAKPPTVTW